MAEVPVIDFTAFREGGAAGKATVATAIREACEDTGFFYLSGHGIAQSQIDAIFAASRRFFALPFEERLKVRLTPQQNRGYQPLGSRMYGDKADAPDLNESFKYQHELPPDDPDILDGNRVHAANLWPENLPGWRETLIGYYDQMERLTDGLLRGFALALDLPEGYFHAFYRKPLTQINLLHYPPHPPVTPGRQYGLRPHSDTTAFTVLAQGEVGGLQVEQGGDWIEAPPLGGTFVINIGDMMARWTNDRFASTPHRVINRSGLERYSVPFFAIPDFDAVVECLPSCAGPGRPAKYPPLRVGDFMRDSNAKDWSKDRPTG
jgi:isopenicillin N synthase-like dioxygenase